MTVSLLRLVGNTDDAEHVPPLSAVERSVDGAVIVHTTVFQAAPDELIAFPFGIAEEAVARSVVRTKKLRTVKIGRRLYARRSDILALAETIEQAVTVRDSKADTHARCRHSLAR
jgi:hypothetical protein